MSTSGSASVPGPDLPEWFTQTAEQVAGAAQLKSFFLQPEFEHVDLIAAINDQLPLSAALVDEKVNNAARPYAWPFTDDQLTTAFPNYSPAQRARKTANQINIATEATRLLVAAALWRFHQNSDGDNPEARAAADGRDKATSGIARLGSADSLLGELCAGVAQISEDIQQAGGKGNGRGVILTGNGDYSDELDDEY